MEIKNLILSIILLFPQTISVFPGTTAPSLVEAPDLDASIQLVVGPIGSPSQGTIVYIPGEGYAIITHDHFSAPALTSLDPLYIKEHGEDFFTGKVELAAHQPDASRYDEVNIIPVGTDYSPRSAENVTIASPEEIGQIEAGDWLVVVFNAGTQTGKFDLQYASFQVTGISDTALQLSDPDRLINRGDSGGAVYFDGELVGVLWSIGDYDFGPGVNVSLLRAP